jgi:hypothetical protein
MYTCAYACLDASSGDVERASVRGHRDGRYPSIPLDYTREPGSRRVCSDALRVRAGHPGMRVSLCRFVCACACIYVYVQVECRLVIVHRCVCDRHTS